MVEPRLAIRWLLGPQRQRPEPPQRVGRQKALIGRWERLSLDEAVQAGIDAFARSWDSDEPVRLLTEFRDARRRAKAGA